MRSLSLLTLTFVGLIFAPPTFGSSAMAANIHAQPPHARSPQRRRLAQSYCRPQHVSREQLVAGALSAPWFVGNPPPLYINGVRVCVDPHGPPWWHTDPATGNPVIDHW